MNVEAMVKPGGDLGVQGTTVIVTGGASGIGRGIAEAFGRAGANVAIAWWQSETGAAETVQAIEANGSRALAIQADVTKEDGVSRLVQTTRAEFGRIDTLVTNAGGLLQRSSIADCSLDLWQRSLAINLTSMFLCCRAVLPVIARPGGSIVTISSLAGHDGGGVGSAHYATAKGGVQTFTRALAKEVGPDGIRVNSVAPGLIGTQFHDRFSTPEGRAATVARTPLRREGTPDDVAGAVLYLASPHASFITGETIEVNGGQGVY